MKKIVKSTLCVVMTLASVLTLIPALPFLAVAYAYNEMGERGWL